MRLAIQLCTVAVFSALVAITGCGHADNEPKAVNVKKDPRIQRDTPDTGNKTQTNIPAK